MHALLILAAVVAAQSTTPASQTSKPVKKDQMVCSWEVSRGGMPYRVCSTRRERDERSYDAQKEVRIMQQRASQSGL